MSRKPVYIPEEEIKTFVRGVAEKYGLNYLPSYKVLRKEYGSYTIITAINNLGGHKALVLLTGLPPAPVGNGRKRKGESKWVEIFEDAEARGLTIAEVALETNTTMTTVQKEMKKRDVELRATRYSRSAPTSKEDFITYWNKHNGNIVKIANEFGVWDNTIRVWARKYGLVKSAKTQGSRSPAKWEGDIAGAEVTLLTGAIVWKAMTDYIEAVNYGDDYMKADCENFFKSEWGKTLVASLPEYVQRRIEVLGLRYE